MQKKLSQATSFFRALPTNEHAVMALLATAVGLAAGFGALGFRYLIEFVQSIAYGERGNLLEVLHLTPWYWRFWMPAIGGFLVGSIIYFLARDAKGIGIAEVMEAVALRKGVIKKKFLVVEALTSAICIGTGGSAGVIAPTVFIGSSLGSITGQILKISADRIRTLVGCGAAAGIAAMFNAPIGGCMFALEVILGDFGLASFSPIVISSVVATVVSRHYVGTSPAIVVPPYQFLSEWELPLYALFGLMCALVAVLFTTSLHRADEIFSKLKFPEYLKAALGGLITGVVALLFPQILGSGFPAIDLALMGDMSWGLMFLLIFFKILGTATTLGSGGAGGTFAPSLFLGAMAGGVFGTLTHGVFPGTAAAPGAYSIVGMGAVVSATTHGPLSAVLILFEMTDNYRIILPLMLTCIISFAASSLMMKESIFTMKLMKKGVNIRAGKEVNVLKSMTVREAMNAVVETIPQDLTLGKLEARISQSKYHSFPVVDEKGDLAGILSYSDYHHLVPDKDLSQLIIVKDIATPDVVTVNPEDSLYTALERITPKDFSILPVVSQGNPNTLLGIVTRRDIVGAYNSAVIKKPILRE